MSTVSYMPKANRRCDDCGCTKAVPETLARRDAALAVIPTRPCGRCDDYVEVDLAPLFRGLTSQREVERSCDDCGNTEGVNRVQVDLPDNLGTGWVAICAECVAGYDEGRATWAR